MRIAIIGAGNVGSALATGWLRAGHEVVFGVRDPNNSKTATLLSDVSGAKAVTVAAAARNADVVVLATPWPATRDALRSAGDLSGRVVLDCTNPVTDDLQDLSVGRTTSAGEQIAAWANGARVVKIFNTTGAPNMANPRYPAGPATMLYCGDDAEAKALAARLATEIGFEPVDAGALREARFLEPFALVWIHLALFQKLGTGFVLNLVKR
jgi:predicted dinucleotide-binding enzyme